MGLERSPPYEPESVGYNGKLCFVPSENSIRVEPSFKFKGCANLCNKFMLEIICIK